MSVKGKAQRYVYKIHSSRLKNSNYKLELSLEDAKRNNELIALSESQLIRFIDLENNVVSDEKRINEIRKEIKILKLNPNISEAKPKINEKYKELYSLLLKEDYVNVVIDKIPHYKRLFEKGFILNGKKYKRLLGTSGGVKNSTIVFISESLWENIDKRINNGRDKSKEFSPAKFEAYKGLVCSSSLPVSDPGKVAVVHDVITEFKTKVIRLDDTDVERPNIDIIEDYENHLDNSDGYGMASPELMTRWGEELGLHYMLPGCVVRNAFLKGALVPIDFKKFAHDNGFNEITDVWGNTYDIDDIELILTESMLKLWSSYDSYERYIWFCKNNGYTYSVTKTCDNELEKVRNMNYQFLQSYEFTDEEIDELISPTVNEINEILEGDYRKTILYTKGVSLSKKYAQNYTSDFSTALMIEPKMANDPFIVGQVRSMINKRIQDAKVGVLKVRGNYCMAVGDPYSLCQSIFGMEVTGLLKAGEIYSNEWRKIGSDKIACFRAPMTCHNNIRVMNVVKDNAIADEFYQYITTPIIINSWDNFQDAENGEDFDADANICTDCEVIVRNTKNLPAIVCIQRSGKKCVPTEKDLFDSNWKSFGNEIGAVTNRITSMFEVQSHFEKDSPEYKELEYRIMCGQLYQQATIDKIKGIDCKPMPEEWFTWISNKQLDEDDNDVIAEKEFNRSILADKKPYFMRYIYGHENKKYLDYIKNRNHECITLFGITVDELNQKDDLNEDQAKFLEYYFKKMPLGTGNCTINRICYKIEDLYDGVSYGKDNADFDYSIMKTDTEYSTYMFNKIKTTYEEYKDDYKTFKKKCRTEYISNENIQIERYLMVQNFKEKCFKECSNSEVLCNILLDLCYKKGKENKQFVWDICGEQIIENLLNKNEKKMYIPVQDINGEIEYNGYKYSMVETIVNKEEEVVDSDNIE